MHQSLSPHEEIGGGLGLGRHLSGAIEKCCRASRMHRAFFPSTISLFLLFSSLASALEIHQNRNSSLLLTTTNRNSSRSVLQHHGSSGFGGGPPMGPPSLSLSKTLPVNRPSIYRKRHGFPLCNILSPSVSPPRDSSLSPLKQSLKASANTQLSFKPSTYSHQHILRNAVSAWLLQGLTKRFSEGAQKAAEPSSSSTESAAATAASAAAAAAAAAAESLPPALRRALCGLRRRYSLGIGKAGGGLWLRTCTSIPLAFIVVSLVLFSPLPVFAALGWAQSVLGLREFLGFCRRRGLQGPSLTASAAAQALLHAAAATGDSDVHLSAEALAICGQILLSLLAPPTHKGIADVAVSLFAHLWGAFLPSFWVRVRALSLPLFLNPIPTSRQQQGRLSSYHTDGGCIDPASPVHRHQLEAAAGGEVQKWGFFSRMKSGCMQAIHISHQALAASLATPWSSRFLVLYGLLLIAAHDSIAFLAGSFFGKSNISSLFPLIRGTPLPPAACVSPRKTVVGLAAGAVTSAVLSGLLAAALGAAAATRAAKNGRFLSFHTSHREANEWKKPQLAAATAKAGEAARGTATAGEDRVKTSVFARQCIIAFDDGLRKKGKNRSLRIWCLARLWCAGSIVGLNVAAAAVAGDLLASLMKRDAGVKDSGALLPGHGGWIDRTDAHLISGPLLFCVARCMQKFLLQLQEAALYMREEGRTNIYADDNENVDACKPAEISACWLSKEKKEEGEDEPQTRRPLDEVMEKTAS